VAVGAGAMLLCNLSLMPLPGCRFWSWHGNFCFGDFERAVLSFCRFFCSGIFRRQMDGFGDVKNWAIFLGLALPLAAVAGRLNAVGILVGGGVGLVLLASGHKRTKEQITLRHFFKRGSGAVHILWPGNFTLVFVSFGILMKSGKSGAFLV